MGYDRAGQKYKSAGSPFILRVNCKFNALHCSTMKYIYIASFLAVPALAKVVQGQKGVYAAA